ncbi:hypothetical protein AZI87_02580 [Bdellovibrio bacteriovorus]|uniref:Uncharacterized protein n=1 Tax=Bdellovibrio bacteriovorus TaxID=959 RepID=A0A161PTN7_BDEBC|nr:beta-propeller fold lactonase family protein [Bdellovibrio bacteriovorus]KYG68166.1 hypothetical protein AZI87_02580 [Bdellovibrio bacteriovorus]
MKALVPFLAMMATSFGAYAGPSDLSAYFSKDFLMKKADTGCMPKGMKADKTGDFLYVAEMCGKIDPAKNQRMPTASVFDLKKQTLVKTLVTPAGPTDGIFANTEVDISIDGKFAFISRAEGGKTAEVFKNGGLLSVVNTETQNIVKYIPTKGEGSKIIASRPIVAERPSEQILYVANYFSDDISVIDVTNLKDDGNLDGSRHLVKKIRLQTRFTNPSIKKYLIAPRGITFTPDGKYALILATETGSLIIVDALNHQQIAEISPIEDSTAGRPLNLRHVVVTKNGRLAYFSHMRGNAVSRIDMENLMEEIAKVAATSMTPVLPSSVWNRLLVPFNTPKGLKKILILEDYPLDHPNFPGKKWDLAHPNTIVLDPLENRYLFVSSRTTSYKDDSKVDPKIKGKIDIIDTRNGKIVFTLVGGAQPTALEVSPDGSTLISAGLKDDKVYFYDISKIISLYQRW